MLYHFIIFANSPGHGETSSYWVSHQDPDYIMYLGLNVLHGVLCGQLSSHPELERIGPLSDKCQFNDIQYCMNIYNYEGSAQ